MMSMLRCTNMLSRMCSMLLSDPVSRLSTQITRWPRRSSSSHRCDPRNPAPPVTREVGMAEEDNPGSGATGTGFELERFEFVTGAGMHALVRVRGRWARPLDPAAGPPQLVADLRGRRQRFAPVDPREAQTFDPGAAEAWRGAYAVPAALLERRDVAYAIDGPGGLTGLPPPGEHARGAGGDATQARELERATAERDE